MFKLLLKFNKRDYILIAIACGFIVLGVWFDLSIPTHMGNIAELVRNESGTATTGQVVIQGVYMLSFAIGSVITSFIIAWIAAMVSAGQAEKIRREIYQKVDGFSLTEVKKFSTASLITRSTNDVTQVRMFTAMAIQMLIRAPVLAIWAIVKISNSGWQISLVTATVVFIISAVMIVILALCLPRFKKVQKLTDDLNRVSRENLTGVRVVRAYNAKYFEQAKFEKVNHELAGHNMFVGRVMGFAWPFYAMILTGVTVAIYWVGSSMIGAGTVAAAAAPKFAEDLIVFSQYSMNIMLAFILLIWVLTMLPRTLVSAKRISEVLETKVSIESGDLLVEENFKNIEFKNVGFKYPGAEENVLSDISLTIKRGQTVAFIGSTGCGKSTLVNLLSRIYDPSEGEVSIGGTSVKNMQLESLNDAVGYVPQTAIIFGGTVKENVAFGSSSGKDPGDDDVVRALKIAQAWDFVEKYEEGINAPIEQRGKNLSGGQKQRLSIARIVARNPKIFIFDDTFSALDYKTDKNLRKALKKELKDATVLIVAQRIGTIKNVDQIFVMENGRIVGSGKHDELLQNCKVYKEIALSQLSEEELLG